MLITINNIFSLTQQVLLKMNKCSVGVLQSSDCHIHAYSNLKKTSLISVSDLNDEECQLLHIQIANEL